MAMQPSSSCAGCHAPLAPGAKFCGACGRSSVAGPVPPHGDRPQPPTPPPPRTAAPAAGYDAVLFAGSPEQAMPRVAAALAQAGVQTLGQTMGGIRFQHGASGSRLLGEATLRPDGQGNTAVSTSVQVDQANFMLLWGISAVVGLIMALIVFKQVFLIVLIAVAALVGWFYWKLCAERTKVQERVTASLRQAAAPAAGYAPTAPGAGYAPAAPAAGYAPAGPAYAAPRPSAPIFAPAPGPAPTSPVERLQQLAEQRDRGVLTPAEFAAAKATILGQI